jgi:hypothetical protein
MELRCPLSICVQEFEDEEGMKKHLKEEHPEWGHTYVDDGDDGDGNNAERNNGEDAGSKDNDAGNERS